MAGFLDKNTRIIDMVLTGEGKFLLSKGDLHFVYWAAFDDEIDYDPVLHNTGSMTAQEIEDLILAQIEETPVRECTTGYRRTNVSGSDFTNVNRPLFNMPQGQTVLPQMKVHEGDEVELTVKQQKVVDVHIQRDAAGNLMQMVGPFDRGFDRFDSSTAAFSFGYTRDSYPPDHQYEGFLIKVYRSGSEGFIEVGQKYDLLNELSYNNDLKVYGAGAVGTSK